MKKTVAVLATTISLAGCSVAGHNVSAAQSAWCGYHTYRLVQDVRHHHMGWGTLQGLLAAHHCSKVVQ